MKALLLYIFCLILASLLKSGDSHGCRLMVDDCDEECHDICKATCSKNFGVCAEEERISYCYCFETRPKEEWISEWSSSSSSPLSHSSSSSNHDSHQDSSDQHENHHDSRYRNDDDL